jgi:hypothetical protein
MSRRHPPQDTGGISSSLTHVSSSPMEDDTLNIPTRDVEQSTHDADTSDAPDDTASEVPASEAGLPQRRRRRRGLDHDTVEDLTSVDGRYTVISKLYYIYFILT